VRKTRKATSRLGLAGSSGSFVFSEASRRLAGSAGVHQSYLLARFERLELERRFESDVLLRRVERVVLREVVRRFVPVLRRAVDLRGLDLRAVDLRPDDRRVVLRDAVLRPVLLRPVDLRPVLLRPEVLRALEDLRLAPVLPVRSRRFVRR
jgi:hypothetical protein